MGRLTCPLTFVLLDPLPLSTQWGVSKTERLNFNWVASGVRVRANKAGNRTGCIKMYPDKIICEEEWICVNDRVRKRLEQENSGVDRPTEHVY